MTEMPPDADPASKPPSNEPTEPTAEAQQPSDIEALETGLSDEEIRKMIGGDDPGLLSLLGRC